MAAAEMADYLASVSPDYNAFFSVCPQNFIPEMVSGSEKLLIGYDQSEERISLSDRPECFVKLQWEFLSEADAGTILDFYCDTAKAKRTTRSFKWAHPTDGHNYVVRFADPMEREISSGIIMSVREIRLKILGVVAP
jgi:hypothetical protein